MQGALASHSPTTATSACARRGRQIVAAAIDRRQEPASAARTAALERRSLLAGGAAAMVAAAGLAPLLQQAAYPPAAAAEAEEGQQAAAASSSSAASIEVVEEQPGSGSVAARQGDLVLVHYVGRTESGGIFDSTLGGQDYRDGGKGVLRPAIIRLGGSPVPGICAGLQQGIQGMRVGGRRTFTVPPSLGFGSGTVLAPYGIVPGGSTLQYEVQLLRLSRRGPDALMSGISQCGGGFVNERTSGCADIEPAEFV